MTTDQLKKLHQARPFRPFRMHLADGRSFDVTHPEILPQSLGGRALALATSPEAFEHVDLLLVTSLGELDPKDSQRRRKA